MENLSKFFNDLYRLYYYGQVDDYDFRGITILPLLNRGAQFSHCNLENATVGVTTIKFINCNVNNLDATQLSRHSSFSNCQGVIKLPFPRLLETYRVLISQGATKKQAKDVLKDNNFRLAILRKRIECSHCATIIHTRLINACTNCPKCLECCECTACNNCNARVDSTCGDCNSCSECCECRHCDSCGDVTDNTCDNGHCNDCCECNDNSQIYTKNPLKYFNSKKTERKINACGRYVAVEIEVAKWNGDDSLLPRVVNKWSASIVEDGSIGNGFEVNTSPANGDLFVSQITDICKGIERIEGKVDTSCGLHVHVDARDYDYYAIRRLILLYAKIEKALFDMVPASRKNNQYCVPCADRYLTSGLKDLKHKSLKEELVKTNYGETVYKDTRSGGYSTKDLRKEKYNRSRYNALNLHSWFYRGTIECRLFNGTVNPDKIIAWGTLWGTIIEYVATHTEKDIEALPTGMEGLLILAPNRQVREFILERINQHRSERS